MDKQIGSYLILTIKDNYFINLQMVKDNNRKITIINIINYQWII